MKKVTLTALILLSSIFAFTQEEKTDSKEPYYFSIHQLTILNWDYDTNEFVQKNAFDIEGVIKLSYSGKVITVMNGEKRWKIYLTFIETTKDGVAVYKGVYANGSGEVDMYINFEHKEIRFMESESDKMTLFVYSY
tara:strand:+ start:656 stop:1063 length:408 start_codon:yes stop_codon:yes gene_type:complete